MQRLRAIGVDGCRAGWVVAAADVDARGVPGAITISVVPDFAAVLDTGADRIAVDIPIGLPDERGDGGRACDVAARRALGLGRGASVFPGPPRPALELASFEDPRRPALGLTQQSFAILPKIREVDAAMTPPLQDPREPGPLVMEVHPEVVFMDLNEGLPMPETKRAPEGLVRRRMLLEDALARPLPVMIPRGAGQDDVLDALACLWVAASPIERLSALPSDGVPRDGRGLAMQIWRRDAVDVTPPPEPPARRTARKPSPEAAAVARLLEVLGPLPGVTVVRGAGDDNRLDVPGEGPAPARLQFGDLRLEGPRCRIVVEVEAAGGVTNLAKYWPLLRDGLDDKRFVLVHLFHATTPGDYALHRRTWRFLADRIREDMEDRGRGGGTAYGWDAELVVFGTAVTDDPFPGVARRIRAALDLPEDAGLEGADAAGRAVGGPREPGEASSPGEASPWLEAVPRSRGRSSRLDSRA
jgi:predicted RNase H-like nuclease